MNGHYKRLYAVAQAAIQRCHNPKNLAWDNYGGRGITVWEPWRKDVHLFVRYLMTLAGWDDFTLTLDRYPDNEATGGYRPDNLRFATRKEQANNKRPRGNNTRRVSFKRKKGEDRKTWERGNEGRFEGEGCLVHYGPPTYVHVPALGRSNGQSIWASWMGYSGDNSEQSVLEWGYLLRAKWRREFNETLSPLAIAFLADSARARGAGPILNSRREAVQLFELLDEMG